MTYLWGGCEAQQADRRAANRAVGVSAVGFAVTGLFELVVAMLTGSVGLLGDALQRCAGRVDRRRVRATVG